MDFLFKEEHRLFRKTVHEFVEKEVIPKAEAIDESSEFRCIIDIRLYE